MKMKGMDMGSMDKSKPGGMDRGGGQQPATKPALGDGTATGGQPSPPMTGRNRGGGKGGIKAAPLGTFMTGHRQLQAAYPQETLLDYTRLRAPQPSTLPAGPYRSFITDI